MTLPEHDGPIDIIKTIHYKSCGKGSDYCKYLDVVPEWVEEAYGERYMMNVWKCKYLDRIISGNETPRWCPYLNGEITTQNMSIMKCHICNTTMVQIHPKIMECPTCGAYTLDIDEHCNMSEIMRKMLYAIYTSKIKHPCNTDELLHNTLQHKKERYFYE